MDKIVDIFPGAKVQQNKRRYLTEEANQHSVGILKCRRSQLSFEDDRTLMIRDNSNEYCRCACTAHNSMEMQAFIQPSVSNTAPDQDVLVLFSLGRPYTAEGKFGAPRCYLLVVGLIKSQ